MQTWLENTPGLEAQGFNFWSQYQKAVEKMLKDNELEIEASHICAQINAHLIPSRMTHGASVNYFASSVLPA